MVAFVIGKWAVDVLKSSINTLMESSPLDILEVKEFIEQKDEVLDLHDIHIWEITGNMYNMTAHVKINEVSLRNYEKLLQSINEKLKEKFKIVHTTFQVEW
jgi:cobalt-zinc-cadmium efflux system protein